MIKSHSLMCKGGSARHEDSPTNLTTVEKLLTCVEVICIVLTAARELLLEACTQEEGS